MGSHRIGVWVVCWCIVMVSQASLGSSERLFKLPGLELHHDEMGKRIVDENGFMELLRRNSSYTPVWPEMKFGWRSVVGTIIGFFGAALGSIGGVGGGGFFVPMLTLFIGFDPKSSITISKCMIMGAAGSTVYYNLRRRHPTLDLPIIDYDLAMLFQPMLMLGISIGVAFNVMFADWMVTVLLIILFVATSTKAFLKGIETWKKETIMKKEALKMLESDSRSTDDGEQEDYKPIPSGPPTLRVEKVPLMENVCWREFTVLLFVWVAFLAVHIVKGSFLISSETSILKVLMMPMKKVETDREAGANKGVSDKQIRLKMYSPNVLDITLVDLPGITKVPVGDQPYDIEARIRTMILSYIKHPSCLILAVTPANTDLANSDALQIVGTADPDGYRTIGVITKLDIMDRGTDAHNFLLGKVVPLRLGYVGVVNRSQQDIMQNLSIKDALALEESFFRSRPVYNGLADRCGVHQLAKKLNQILVQHIKTVLPELKSRISSSLVAVAKEHASYGEITESKAGQGALLLNILSKFSEAFTSMVEGKNEEMSTSELSGGARIHYIFQSIFVKSLEEVDPCDDLTDDDIRTAIQNATGPRSALFVPEVPFEVLMRRQIARLLDPSLQCSRFIYDELVKMSHRCLVNELQRFPTLRKRMDEVIGFFLREGLEPSETMIGHLIEMEMDYINTSHPNFIGGSKAVESALQQVKSSRVSATMPRLKDGTEADRGLASEKAQKSRGILARSPANGIVTDQIPRPVMDAEKHRLAGNNPSSSWGISSIFGGNGNRISAKDNSMSRPCSEPVPNMMEHNVMEHALSMIQLREPPSVLRPSETRSEQEAIEIAVTKLLLRSYYDIVRKNIEDSVPKAIMHFLVNHTKRDLHNVFIKKLYRDNLFEEMLQEPDEVAMKRKRTREMLHVLQQAFRTLDELPMEAETIEKCYSLGTDPTGLPKIHGLPSSSSSFYSPSSSNDYNSYSSLKNPRSRKSSHSGELNSPSNANMDNGNLRQGILGSSYSAFDT